jgi:hypothetical protein
MAVRATPKVAAVPQDVPVSREAKEQSRKAAGRKIRGVRMSSPVKTR